MKHRAPCGAASACEGWVGNGGLCPREAHSSPAPHFKALAHKRAVVGPGHPRPRLLQV